MNDLTVKDTIPAISHGPFTATPTGLIVTAPVPYEVWEAYGGALRRVESSLQWVIGDWLVYGEDTYGEKYAQATSVWPGKSIERIKRYAWASQCVPKFLRKQSLSWSHHLEVGALDSADQKMWLDRAEKEGWSVRELRTKIGMRPSKERMEKHDYRGVNTPFGKMDAVRDVLWLDPETIGRFKDDELLALLHWWEKEGSNIYQEYWDRMKEPLSKGGPGHVYFLRRSDGATKIGYTRRLEGRINQLNLLEKERLAIVRIIKADHPMLVEQAAHNCFDEYRISGEWFQITTNQINEWKPNET